MKFELVNPSDAYTMEADDMEVAAVACCLLGNGKYALKGIGEDAGSDVPVFLLGGHDQWFVSKFGMDYETTATHCLEHRAGDLARAFDSVTLTSGKRSSLNNIGASARALAQAVRRKSAAQPAP